jgi:KUP system potassium uptake protein
VLLNVVTEQVPRIEPQDRVRSVDLPDDFHALWLRYGFMEQSNIPVALSDEKGECPLHFNMMDTSFFVGRLSVTPRGHSRWWRLKMQVFKLMYRNALPVWEFFRIPAGRVVELGGQIEL